MEVRALLRRIFSYMGKYKKYAALAIACVAAESMFELIVPLIMADLIDVGVANQDRHYIYMKGFQMVICAVLACFWESEAPGFQHLQGRGLEPNCAKQSTKSFRVFPLLILIISGYRLL